MIKELIITPTERREIIKIEIIASRRTIFKGVCSLSDKKKLAEILSYLHEKFDIDIVKILKEYKESAWF